MLAELHFDNPTGKLLPGMYAQVHFKLHRPHPPLLVPGDVIVTGKSGAQVALLRGGDVVHYQSVDIGRDYGAQTEILAGLNQGDLLVLNPTEELREGVRVRVLKEAK